MFGEVVSGDEGRDVGFEVFQVVVMVGLDRGVLDRADFIRSAWPLVHGW